MSTWTPGPWKTEMSNGSSFVRGQNGKLVAGSYDSLKAVLWADESIENARLIALSPEWPDVLRECVKMLDDCCQYALDLGPINREKLEKARALLARLEGGEK